MTLLRLALVATLGLLASCGRAEVDSSRSEVAAESPSLTTEDCVAMFAADVHSACTQQDDCSAVGRESVRPAARLTLAACLVERADAVDCSNIATIACPPDIDEIECAEARLEAAVTCETTEI